ncbi:MULTISPECIES: hypothetical protein [unclassified Bradyrhizobium]
MSDGILKQVFDLLGLSAPFLYASTTASFFAFADRRTSKDAKKTINEWLKPANVGAPAVSNALVEVFDRVYGKELLSWKAFGRSALISLVVTAIYILELRLAVRILNQKIGFDFFINWIQPVLFNIVTDYIALFVIRKWLLRGGASPFFTLVFGAVIGMTIVLVFAMARAAATELLVIAKLLIEAQTTNLTMTAPQYWYVFKLVFHDYWDPSTWSESLVAPALAVHSWLLLFAIAVAALKLFNPFVRSIGWLQWLVANGKNRPIEVIGYIASAVVLIGSAAVIHFKSVLS